MYLSQKTNGALSLAWIKSHSTKITVLSIRLQPQEAYELTDSNLEFLISGHHLPFESSKEELYFRGDYHDRISQVKELGFDEESTFYTFALLEELRVINQEAAH